MTGRCAACAAYEPARPGAADGYCNQASGATGKMRAFDGDGRPAFLSVAADFGCSLWAPAGEDQA